MATRAVTARRPITKVVLAVVARVVRALMYRLRILAQTAAHRLQVILRVRLNGMRRAAVAVRAAMRQLRLQAVRVVPATTILNTAAMVAMEQLVTKWNRRRVKMAPVRAVAAVIIVVPVAPVELSLTVTVTE